MDGLDILILRAFLNALAHFSSQGFSLSNILREQINEVGQHLVNRQTSYISRLEIIVAQDDKLIKLYQVFYNDLRIKYKKQERSKDYTPDDFDEDDIAQNIPEALEPLVSIMAVAPILTSPQPETLAERAIKADILPEWYYPLPLL